MSTDFSIRPVGAPVAAPVVRPQPDAATQAVSTLLPAPKTPTPPDGSGAADNDPQASSDQFSRDVVIDRAAATIVYQLVDSETGQVVSEYPDAARLRARAYQRSLDEAKLDQKMDQRA
jgi:hypothetical protein